MTPINEFHITGALECHTENIDLHNVAVNISQYEWDGWPPHIPSTLAREAQSYKGSWVLQPVSRPVERLSFPEGINKYVRAGGTSTLAQSPAW